MTTASEIATAEAAYFSNADYAEVRSAPKARAFVTACRKLLIAPSSMVKGANSISNRIDLLRDELRDAQKWLERFSPDDIPGPIVTKTDFRNFRGYGG